MPPKGPKSSGPGGTENQQTSDREDIYYGALVQAWFETRMEKDRTLVGLSAGAVGILVTILTTVGAKARWHLLLIGGSGLCFLVAIGVGIFILGMNSKYLEEEVAALQGGRESPKQDFGLGLMDKLMVSTFGIGVVLALVFGLCSADHRSKCTDQDISGGSKPMSTKKDPCPEDSCLESMSGASRLRPSKPEFGKEVEKSVSGASKLRPSNPESTKIVDTSSKGAVDSATKKGNQQKP